ncbi:LANO_0F13102g1_1 [Lachancea nothofagi CBS 11611]|uniref:Peptide hydrolase n=1 Tax=Lachancea nothofagi CBS 11611 TaxID=1266666 RepID=A0A1G4KBL8_9SACH|nr:LANO_0F13102g1_1 [Lachancea nothofagi CBS 11611]
MLSGYLRSLCRFRKTSVSVFLVATYAIIGALYVWDKTRFQTLKLQESEQRLLDDAWLSLQNITQNPHEYVSRQNDVVHDFILDRAQTLLANVSYAQISDDYETKNQILFKQPDVFNSSSKETRVIYFESSNIMVKIDGSEPGLEGLLLSAHFDSVPTGFGATDDGMGVVTLLAALSKLTEKQPRRTVIFNFNNNEEFGLLGASAFLNHPWSKLVHYVLNLEGAGAGGKAVLFRTSDSNTASIYKQAVQDQPFGNSIYQQGFYDRYISSETDYKVYEQAGLRGWDIAFYKPRAFYHTARDSISHTSKASLWHMMQAALQITELMTFESFEDDPSEREPAIYFDVLGMTFVTMSAKKLFTINCALLAVIPIIVLALELVVSRKKTRAEKSVSLWLRLPFSLMASYLTIATGRSLLFKFNPLIFSRDYFSPTIGFSSCFVTVNYIILSFFEYWAPTQDFKTVALIEMSFGLWLCLLLATIRLYSTKYQATGLYIFSIVYSLSSLSGIVGLLCAALKRESKESGYTIEPDQIQDESQSNTDSTVRAPQTEEPDERAPLLVNSRSSQSSSATHSDKSIKKSVNVVFKKTMNYDWSIQFLTLVPLASFFTFMCLSQVLDAVYQTCQDGFQASWNVSMISMLGGMLFAFPLLPFSYKLNYFVSMLVLFIAACSGITSFIKTPFSDLSPLKLRFSQEIDLKAEHQLSMVNVFGRQGAGIDQILKDIPTVEESNGKVSCQSNGHGSETCSYAGLTPNLISSNRKLTFSDVMSIDILSNNRDSSERSPYEPINAEIRINVLENRMCSITFNSSQYADYTLGQSPVKQVTVFGSSHYDNRTKTQFSTVDGMLQDGKDNRIFKWSKGINSLQLHKLNFERGFYHIGIQWIPRILSQNNGEEVDETDALGLHVRCFWGDYNSVSVVGGEPKRKVPAFDELLSYSPTSVSYANKEAAMVILNDYIEL